MFTADAADQLSVCSIPGSIQLFDVLCANNRTRVTIAHFCKPLPEKLDRCHLVDATGVVRVIPPKRDIRQFSAENIWRARPEYDQISDALGVQSDVQCVELGQQLLDGTLRTFGSSAPAMTEGNTYLS